MKNNWRDHEYAWVQGCIDSYGSIRAFASKQIEIHEGEYNNGKRWRFNINSQEFVFVAPRTVDQDLNRKILQLTIDEDWIVCEWLIKNGYADERIYPPKDE